MFFNNGLSRRKLSIALKNLAFGCRAASSGRPDFDLKDVFDGLTSFCVSCYRGNGFSFTKNSHHVDVYSTAMAVSLLGLLGDLENDWLDQDRVTEFLLNSQKKSGYFIDDRSWEGNGKPTLGWGHLLPIVTTALEYLNTQPNHKFEFLEKFNDLSSISFSMQSQDSLKSSNKFFDLMCSAVYGRDVFGVSNYNEIISNGCCWALQFGIPEALRRASLDSFEAAISIKILYHIVPVLLYEGYSNELGRFDFASLVCKNVNAFSGFGPRWDSHACEDIDNLYLLKFFNNDYQMFRDIVTNWLYNSFPFNIRSDGGLVYRPTGSLWFLGSNKIHSSSREGDMFGSWFRCVNLAYVLPALEIQPCMMHFTKQLGYQTEFSI